MDSKKVWFITGASKGLGLSLVKQLLEAGQYVAGTSRNPAELHNAVGENPNFLPLQVDLANEASVSAAIKTTVDTFKSIDVVVNNAGYGIGGSIEELTDKETRDSFDINVFGTLNVVRHVLPYMRAQLSGHIINISSIAGIAPATGWAVYGATKFAVAGLTEVLAADVKAFGIKVTLVAPGAFRTSFLTPDSLSIAANSIDAYKDVHETHARYLKMNGTQIGDPEKAAKAMIAVVDEPNPPLYLLLGSDAYSRAITKVENMVNEFRKWEGLTKSTDYQTV
ncbi:SDR family NAD(P)-dependent oxidoreductase [Mucilaginibacter gynuensis]|uniref:SDR family NAD(P)-dependent oxidoreductase n=1 Tax=Mucilaginibacter gynuensis TaxID=1302236 RepID=A0ABP8G345_9SPHI